MKNIVLKSLQFATKKHDRQVRKGDNRPYITHPLAVSYIIASYKRSKYIDNILAASLLHDTLEDTETTFAELVQEFNPMVASLVYELTSDVVEIERIGKTAYLKKKMLGMSSYALVIKLSDRLHNISDNPSEKTISETEEIVWFLKKNRKLSKTHLEIVTQILELIEK